MKKQLKKIYLLALLSQSSWGQEQHLMLWNTAHETTAKSIPGLFLEIFSSIETRGEKPEIEDSQCIRVDACGWFLSKEIHGSVFFPHFNGSFYPLDIQIISAPLSYNLHVSADYGAVSHSSTLNMHQSLLYKGVVLESATLRTLIPLDIAADLGKVLAPLKFLGLSLWPTQYQAESKFMTGEWTVATGFDPYLTTKGNYLQIDPSVTDLSPNGLTVTANLLDGSLRVTPL